MHAHANPPQPTTRVRVAVRALHERLISPWGGGLVTNQCENSEGRGDTAGEDNRRDEKAVSAGTKQNKRCITDANQCQRKLGNKSIWENRVMSCPLSRRNEELHRN